ALWHCFHSTSASASDRASTGGRPPARTPAGGGSVPTTLGCAFFAAGAPASPGDPAATPARDEGGGSGARPLGYRAAAPGREPLRSNPGTPALGPGTLEPDDKNLGKDMQTTPSPFALVSIG